MNAQFIADCMQLDTGSEARTFAQCLVSVPVDWLDGLLDRMSRVAPGAEIRAGARLGVSTFLERAEPLNVCAPTVLFSFCDRAWKQPFARFFDGRHRFAVLRDAGAKRINIGCQLAWGAFWFRAGIARAVEVGGPQVTVFGKVA